MATSIQAKIAPLPRGDYSSSATYAKLDVVSYNGSSYMAIKAVPTGTAPTNTTYWQLLAATATIPDGSISTSKLADGAVTLAKLDSSVSDKYAEVSGTYEDMVVGSAEQLLSTQYDTDSVPYAFRKSPYGDREFDEIVGGTVALNQLIQKGNMTDGWSFGNSTGSYSNNVLTFTASAQGGHVRPNLPQSIISGHKYYGTVDIKGTSAFTTNIYFDGRVEGLRSASITTSWASFGKIFANTVTEDNYYPRVVDVRTSGWDAIQIRNCMLVDLTQMLGSTVADAIYAMEQSTTGSGVAFFRSFFPKPYYAYNDGQLISVSGLSAHKMTGFNQFDKSTAVLGSINADGSISGFTGRYVSDWIRCIPNSQYYVTNLVKSAEGRGIAVYDGSKNFIEILNIYVNGSISHQATDGIINIPSNAHYMRVSTNGTAVLDSCCVHLVGDGSRNGEYEPYEVHEYALDDSLTLRGVPKLVNNKVQFDGDIYQSDGTVQRRYGVVDLGSLSWNYQSSSGNMYADNAIPNRLVGGSAICAKYDSHGFEVGSVGGLTDDKQYAFQNTLTTRIIIKDSAYTNATTFTSAMDGVYLVYELATPTTESASPYVSPQICNEYGTEEYVSAEQSGVTMIVGHNTKYPQNLRKKIEGLPWNFSSLIAPTEVTNKATRNYTVGSYLIMNNTLYKVTSAIANGGTITVGTNVTATTIMAEILAL